MQLTRIENPPKRVGCIAVSAWAAPGCGVWGPAPRKKRPPALARVFVGLPCYAAGRGRAPYQACVAAGCPWAGCAGLHCPVVRRAQVGQSWASLRAAHRPSTSARDKPQSGLPGGRSRIPVGVVQESGPFGRSTASERWRRPIVAEAVCVRCGVIASRNQRQCRVSCSPECCPLGRGEAAAVHCLPSGCESGLREVGSSRLQNQVQTGWLARCRLRQVSGGTFAAKIHAAAQPPCCWL